MNTLYQLIDRQTGKVLGTYTYAQRNRARARADRLDNEYGSYRYGVQPIFEDDSRYTEVAAQLK